MENEVIEYCRLCAEMKPSDNMLNLRNDENKLKVIRYKLASLNASEILVSNQDTLPKTVCFVCYDLLNKAYDFINVARNAQDVLNSIFACNDRAPSDNETMTVLAIPDENKIKHESPEQKEYIPKLNININVKEEPKEEFSDSNSVGSLNVEDIFKAATSADPNVTIYAKEIPDISEKSIKAWNDYTWVCSYCDIEFSSLDMLRSHSKLVHGKCATFSCIDCERDIKDDFQIFIRHVWRHRKSLRKCPYCDKPITKTETLSSHIKKHLIKSQVTCPMCGEIKNNQDSLNAHLQEYSNVKPKRRQRRKRGVPITVEELTCELCKKVYKNPNSLRDHMKLHNNDRKREYTCDRCGKMFYNKGTLTSHIMSHDKVHPHVCKICNSSFLFPNMLRRHVEMHSGIKPFACDQCGRRFRLQYQLNSHKIIHTDAMPYLCQYCNKTFRFKQILKNHERQHTGAKPYSCEHCSKDFTNWSNYNKHMKRRHGTDTSKKKITPEGVFPVNPVTGQIIQDEDPVGTEEWKTKIMKPVKRGKKKVIK